MENKTEFSKEQIEYVKLYLEVFGKMYILQTGKKLTSVEQLFDVIKKGDFTFDDVFFTYVEKCFDVNDLTKEEEYFWDDNMKMFETQNYFPPDSKKVEEGAWIKIRTENGFEVHYAKKANRKRRYNEDYEKASEQLKKLLNSQVKDLKNPKLKVAEIVTPKKKERQKQLENLIKENAVRSCFGLAVYEVKIMRTKSVSEYYLPYQYEIVDNIEEFSDAYINSVPGVNIKSLYSSQNKDAVFYLQSRGITKKVAEMMAALKQTYFTVNMQVALTEYGKIFNKQVKEALSA